MVKDNALFNDIMTNAGVGGRMVKATASPQCYLWHYILDEPMDIIKVKRCIPAFTAVNGAPVAVVPSSSHGSHGSQCSQCSQGIQAIAIKC